MTKQASLIIAPCLQRCGRRVRWCKQEFLLVSRELRRALKTSIQTPTVTSKEDKMSLVRNVRYALMIATLLVLSRSQLNEPFQELCSSTKMVTDTSILRRMNQSRA